VLFAVRFRGEVAQWYLAAAANAALDNRLADAQASCDTALQWAPGDPRLLHSRARIRLEAGDLAGSLEDLDQLLAIQAESDGTLQSPTVRQLQALRTMVLQRMGKHDEATRTWESLVEFWRTQVGPEAAPATKFELAAALNNLAYARALAREGIPQGLDEIRQALETDGQLTRPSYLDTRGYLYYLNGDLELALENMETALYFGQPATQRFKTQIRNEMQKVTDQRPYEKMLAKVDENLAVMVYHRALVHEALDNAEQAAADFRRARQLGYSEAAGLW
jgi:tetratricopeptide (TPR) repeat protein